MAERRYRLLVFDWDGTLADSLAVIVRAMQGAIRESGLDPHPEEALLDIIGLGLEQACEQLYPGLAPDRRRALGASYRRHYLQLSSEPVRLYPQAEEVLRELRRQGYFLAVATGKSRRGLDRSLAETGLADCFHLTRCADETRSKPHPQMLLEIADALSVAARHGLMIGDSRHDLQMAANAGMDAVGVTYGAQPPERLLEFQPLTNVPSLRELARWLAEGADTPGRDRA